jgi:hypothetical protein
MEKPGRMRFSASCQACLNLAGDSAGSLEPASANPFARSRQLSHAPHGRPSAAGE